MRKFYYILSILSLINSFSLNLFGQDKLTKENLIEIENTRTSKLKSNKIYTGEKIKLEYKDSVKIILITGVINEIKDSTIVINTTRVELADPTKHRNRTEIIIYKTTINKDSIKVIYVKSIGTGRFFMKIGIFPFTLGTLWLAQGINLQSVSILATGVMCYAVALIPVTIGIIIANCTWDKHDTKDGWKITIRERIRKKNAHNIK